MEHHHISIFFLIIVANIIMGTQCGKDFITPSPTYEFSEKLSLTPYKKVYSINDTIWVQFQTNDKSLYDKKRNTFLLCLSIGLTSFLTVQGQTKFEVPQNVELKTKDDYAKYETAIID